MKTWKTILLTALPLLSLLLVIPFYRYPPLAHASGITQTAYQTIQDEAVALVQRTVVNFTGAGVTCVDNAGAARTDCSIPGGGASASITRGTYASRPACAAANTLYIPTDSKYQMSQCNGVSWVDFLPGGTAATFSAPPTVWFNQGGSTASTTNGGEYLTIPPLGAIYTLRLENIAPGANLNRTAFLSSVIGQRNFAEYGLCATDGTKLECMEIGYSGGAFVRVSSWTNATTFNSVLWPPIGQAAPPITPAGGLWLRVDLDPVNISWSIGDGNKFVTMYSEARGAFLGTISGIGYGAFPDNPPFGPPTNPPTNTVIWLGSWQ